MSDWWDQAACKGHDPAIWHPFHNPARPTVRTDPYATARAICNRCPVRDDCADHAIANNETEGMWGGLTPRQIKARRYGETAA